MQCGGIILCGGKSSRMGLPKATLPFGPELMIQRMVRILGAVVDPIIVVAAPGQSLPYLPAQVTVVHDRREGRGPLEGLAAGLAAVQGRCEAAYATSCDAPLLVPAFVRTVVAALGNHDIAVPKTDCFHHPLAAVYRAAVLSTIEELLAADRMRPFFLFEQVDTLELEGDQLLAVDPELSSLKNLNHPADYLAALAHAGFQPTADVQEYLERRAAQENSASG